MSATALAAEGFTPASFKRAYKRTAGLYVGMLFTAYTSLTRAVMVLADVFKRADERAGDLAADVDQSRGRGVTCEEAYDGLKAAP